MSENSRFQKEYSYKYPNGLKLNPQGDLHKKLLTALKERILRGYESCTEMRTQWAKLDHLQTAYVPATSASILEENRDPKSPVNVVLPISRANLDIIVAYQAGVLMGDPTGMYALQALGEKENMIRAAKMDRLIHTQANWFKHKLSHYTALRDTNLYGLSARRPVWKKRKRKDPVVQQVTEVLLPMLKERGISNARIGDAIKTLEERTVHEGCYIENIDVYSLILDPNTTLNNYEESEFMGFLRRTNAMQLLGDEKDEEYNLFNCKYVAELAKTGDGLSATNWRAESGRFTRFGTPETSDVPGQKSHDTTNEVDVAYVYWNLIPRDWGLGDNEYPERWLFGVAGNEVIIQAYPLNYYHCEFPMVLDGPQTSGYDLLPISNLSAVFGLHQFIDWKIRCHYWNASKVQNDMFVVDGSAVNVQDMKRGGPGKIIRLLRPLYGTDTIDRFIKQLNVNDITNDYMNHVQGMLQLNDMVMGTHAITAGDLSGMPDRPTSYGLQTAANNAVARLNADLEKIQEQSWNPLIRQITTNNVQYMDTDVMVSILGSKFESQIRQEYGQELIGGNDMLVTPWDLDMESFMVMPINRIKKDADVQTMNMVLERMLSVPEIAMEAFGGIDVQRWFMNMVRRMGFSDISEFQRKGGQMPMMAPQMMPDEQIAQQEQAGNLVPMGAA